MDNSELFDDIAFNPPREGKEETNFALDSLMNIT